MIEGPPNPWGLSPMEWTVMTSFVTGLDVPETASHLNISVKTVNTYVGRARVKMTVGSAIPTMIFACIQVALYLEKQKAKKS